MSRVLLLSKDDYYTQRNNTWDDPSTPQHEKWVACMPTSRVMFYIANDIDVVNPQPGVSLDDYFMSRLRSAEAKRFCRKKYPWTTNRRDDEGNRLQDIPPNEVHGMYGSWLDEQVTGKRRSDFRTDLTWEDILALLRSGYAVMTSGNFPTTSGHAVVFIGYESDGSLLYLADPFGNFITSYRDVHGYAIPMNPLQFRRIIRGDGYRKWGHVPYTESQEEAA